MLLQISVFHIYLIFITINLSENAKPQNICWAFYGDGMMAPSGKFHLNGIWEMRKAELVTSMAENNNAFQWQLNWHYY